MTYIMRDRLSLETRPLKIIETLVTHSYRREVAQAKNMELARLSSMLVRGDAIYWPMV